MTSLTASRTPIAGVEYRWAETTGHDELMLLDRDLGLGTAVLLLGLRARSAEGQRLDAVALPVGDVDALVAELRAKALGDRMLAEGRCAACEAPVDVDFSLDGFRQHRSPRRPRGVAPAGEPGWWALPRHGVTLRPPTAGDVLAAQATADPAATLAAATVRPLPEAADPPARAAVAAAERALSALAPSLRDDVEGTCPECGATVALDVDVRELCVAELRFLAGAVLEDVHLLAGAYGWPEEAILDLPVKRRRAYAELIRAARGSPLSVEAFLG